MSGAASLARRFLLLGCMMTVAPALNAARAQNTKNDQREAGSAPEVAELRLTGIKNLSKSELRNALGTKQSGCKSLIYKILCAPGLRFERIYERNFLDEDEFKRDVVRLLVFYFRRGYRDATVDTSVVKLRDNKVRITMAVNEGPPTVVDSIAVQGIGRALAPRDTIRDVRPRAGEPLNLLSLDSSVTRMRERIWERGYVDAVLKLTTVVDDSARRASAEILVDPKKRVTISSIQVEGNERVNEETIRKSLVIEPGDIFRLSRVSNSQRALYESALFRRAVIDTAARDSTAPPDSTKGLVVRVVEAPFREARTSFGFTTADFVQAEGAFTHNYLMDRALRFDATVTIGNLLAQQLTQSKVFTDIANIVPGKDFGRYYAPNYQANVGLTQRWFRSPRNTISAGLFASRRSSPGVLIDRGFGGNATFTRTLANRVPLSARYQFEVSRVEAGDVYFCVNYGVCDKSTIEALRGAQRLSPLAFTLSIDRTDIPFSPTRGVLARAEFEHASKYTASDFRYNRATVEASVYRKIGFRNTVAAAHVRAGWVNPLSSTAGAVSGEDITGNLQILHPRKRLYAGGSQSVRGFGENQLGPRVLTVAASTLDSGIFIGTDSVRTPCSVTAPTPQCLAGLKDDSFQTRPLGGTTLLEGGFELRIPITGYIVAALFVDGAVLGNGSVTTITRGKAAITPGFGVRYKSPVGPIRVDLGIRPSLKAAVPVITEVRDGAGVLRLVDLTGGVGCVDGSSAGCRIYPGPLSKQSFFNKITNRLTLHLSIGEAY
ncbi:MAG: BamA/TamA family outer membrane protein [Phycisphaerae bacterium]|nr:BamA/TamA family outer membrane protein [Gemmatimonadaceae bacterium]